MKVLDVMIYLNGIRMSKGRKGPLDEAREFIGGIMSELLSPNYGLKHKCSQQCDTVWTIAVGRRFTDRNHFDDCVPRQVYYKFERHSRVTNTVYGIL